MPDQTSFHEDAPAKVNLTLAVTGRRTDGYHLLDSMVVFAGICDHISLRPSPTDHLELTGPFASAVGSTPPRENSVWQSLTTFRDATGWDQSFTITLNKKLPVAAGIGGGSSDAAAMLRLLNRLAPDPLSDEMLDHLALDLGADVPVCLRAKRGGLWRMRGIGELLEPLPAIQNPAQNPGLVLFNNGTRVATKDVFAAFSKTGGVKPGRPDDVSSDMPPSSGPIRITDLGSLIADGNDLLKPAIHVAPGIKQSLDILASMHSARGFIASGMSGSGATCFALFTDPDTAVSALNSLGETEGWCWAGGIR